MAINTFTRLYLNFAAILFGGSALLLGTGAAQAGFEWIPPAPQTRSVPAPNVVAAPAARTPSPQELLAPMPLQRIDRVNAPTPQVATETKPTNSAIRFKKLNTPETIPPQKSAAAPDHALDLPALNAEAPTKTSVILPDDTPDLARTQINKKGHLGINFFPKTTTASSAKARPPSHTPIDTPQEEVVGFGTDIPLALALQQIAPQDFTFSFGANINPGSKVSWNGGKGWKDVMSDMILPLGLQASIRGQNIFIHHAQGAGLSREIFQGNPVTSAAPLQLQRSAIRDPGLGT